MSANFHMGKEVHSHGHSYDHGHSHTHGIGHSHGPTEGWRYSISIILNLLVVVAQGFIGFRYGSTALLADAGHNASDVAGLMLAGGAAWLMLRNPTAERTYGFGKAGILAALLNSLLLVFACGLIAFEAVQRLISPVTEPPPGMMVMIAAGIAIIVNIGSAMLLMGGHPDDINRKAAVLHLMADGAISVGVLVAGALILWTGASWIDPIASLVIVVVIIATTWTLMFQSLAMMMDAVPPGYNVPAIRKWLESHVEVSSVHDLHVWSYNPTEVALTVHLVVPDPEHDEALLQKVVTGLGEKFEISHSTIQIERICHQESEHLHE